MGAVGAFTTENYPRQLGVIYLFEKSVNLPFMSEYIYMYIYIYIRVCVSIYIYILYIYIYIL